uniref:hypothetical protein n=1 Tax=Halomonas alkaliantarctica TaxID=232346 RepID=UPI002658254B
TGAFTKTAGTAAAIQKSPIREADKTDLSESVRKVSDTTGAFTKTAGTAAAIQKSPIREADKTDLSESVRKVSDTTGAFTKTASAAAAIQKSPIRETDKTDLSISVRKVSDTTRAFQKKKEGGAGDVNAILDTLKAIGRDLGGDLERLARERLMPLANPVRAEVIAALDDAFMVAPDLPSARKQCRHLLTDMGTLEAAKACWPALPEPVDEVPTLPRRQTVMPIIEPWLTLIEQHCPLVSEDKRFIRVRLATLAPGHAMRLARQYVEAWKQAEQQEPLSHAKDNAGRRAANRLLVNNHKAKRIQ